MTSVTKRDFVQTGFYTQHCWKLDPTMTPREEELAARALLENPALVDICFKEKRWAELAAVVRFARRDVPVSLAQTDPALYRRLRDQVSLFFLLGGDVFSLRKLEEKMKAR